MCTSLGSLTHTGKFDVSQLGKIEFNLATWVRLRKLQTCFRLNINISPNDCKAFALRARLYALYHVSVSSKLLFTPFATRDIINFPTSRSTFHNRNFNYEQRRDYNKNFENWWLDWKSRCIGKENKIKIKLRFPFPHSRSFGREEGRLREKFWELTTALKIAAVRVNKNRNETWDEVTIFVKLDIIINVVQLSANRSCGREEGRLQKKL